jgi:hypothetical protein
MVSHRNITKSTTNLMQILWMRMMMSRLQLDLKSLVNPREVHTIETLIHLSSLERRPQRTRRLRPKKLRTNYRTMCELSKN